jgi:hypothetical protein
MPLVTLDAKMSAPVTPIRALLRREQARMASTSAATSAGVPGIRLRL